MPAGLLPQLRAAPTITRADLADGLSLFVVGLFKKLALADALGLYVNKVYAAPERVRLAGPAAGDVRLRLADLLRFQRLQRHGPRHRRGCSASG